MKACQLVGYLAKRSLKTVYLESTKRGIQPSDLVSIGPKGDFMVKGPMVSLKL